MDSVTTNPFMPSIAYKTFNFSYVDYLWLEHNGNAFNVFYKHDAKHVWVGLSDLEPGKGFTIKGSPNPFSIELLIEVSVKDDKTVPDIRVFNSESRLIKILQGHISAANKFSFSWDGTNQNGAKVSSGIYVLLCTVGDKRTARKVAFVRQ